jgi:eukaryotic-like serine/threonine-protein kinase
MSRSLDEQLGQFPGQETNATLQALLDRQMQAWLGGERLLVETFIKEFPSLRAEQGLVALIHNEIALREAVGETPSLAEYRQRFPQLEGRLRARFFSSGEPSIIQRPAPPTPLRAASPARPKHLVFAEPKPAPPVSPADAKLSSQQTVVGWEPGSTQTNNSQSDQDGVPGYKILGELGRGGMGVVYKARQKSLNRIVALKMVLSGGHASATERDRFRLEADAVGKLKHPNIVQIIDIGESNGRPYFSLEFIEGGTLQRKLDRETMSCQQAAETVELLARAMQTAHDHGIIHRDLKPGNILLTRDGIPKITDFGLAKQMHTDSGHTQTGSILGTPNFMSPEQAEGRLEEVGPASDVYSLGAILYCTLTGRPPFIGATPMETLGQVVHDEPLPPSRLQSRVSRDLETICLKCLAKSPEKRYGSAAELADDLRRHLNGEPIRARAMGRVEQVWRWCRRNPVPASLLLTVVAGGIFGLWYMSNLSQEVVRTSALESAAQQADLFDQLNDFYSKEVVAQSGLPTSTDYRKQKEKLPPPATLAIDLGDYISKHSQLGMHVRVYSDYPFLNRKVRNEGGPRDSFEREALEHLTQDPEEPYYRYEKFKGRPVLRYARARIMKESCVECHNSHPLSPRKDWKVGDVRGVFEIIRPLDADQQRAQSALHRTLVLIGGFSAALLGFSTLVLFFGRRARRSS